MPRTASAWQFFANVSVSDISIRLCKTWAECVECEELQKQVWEMPDYRDAVPANFLITAIKNGGLLVGAFDGERMIGFAFGFLGSEGTGEARRLKHTSHMLAVVPNARFKGLGAEMKWLQRAKALEQGLEFMTWTYDPLQALNAHLNLNGLGAIARRYSRNAYGEMTDALNAGLASDRFEVEWFLKRKRVVERLGAKSKNDVPNEGHMIYRVEWDAMGMPFIADEAPLGEGVNLVEIPVDINAIKAKNLPLAIQWREQTRSTFEQAFTDGYVASGILRREDEQGRARVWYVLRKTGDWE